MSKFSRLVSVSLLVLGAVAGEALLATTLNRMTTRDLIRESVAVARVNIASVETSAADRGMIYTYADLAVLETYRGELPAEITVRVPGGDLDSHKLEIAGMPEFRPGYEVLVFLTRWDDGAFKVLGYVQGLSEIRTVNGKRELVGGTAHGLDLVTLAAEVRAGGPRTVDLRPAN